jgi:hypothetical protein
LAAFNQIIGIYKKASDLIPSHLDFCKPAITVHTKAFRPKEVSLIKTLADCFHFAVDMK